MRLDQLPNQETFRCVACPGPVDKLQSFLHFRDLSLHSMAVHKVALERAVQASTLLPTTLTMFVCKLCPPEEDDSFLTEVQLKIHLEKHSQFFVKRWKEFCEVECRVCEKVIDQDMHEDHLSSAHPRSLYANPKEVNTLEIEEDSDPQKISSRQPKIISGGIRLKPIDLLLDQSKKQSGKSDCRARPAGVDLAKEEERSSVNYGVTKSSEMKPNQLSLVGVKKHVSAENIKNYFSRKGVLVAEVFTCNGIGNVTFVNEEDTTVWSGRVFSIDNCQIRISNKCHYPADLRENELVINQIPKAISVDDLYYFFSREAFDVSQIFLQAHGSGRVMFRTREDADYWADQDHKLIVRGIQLHIWRPDSNIEISKPQNKGENIIACSSLDQGKGGRREGSRSAVHHHMRDTSRERVMNDRGWSEVDNKSEGSRYREGQRDRSRSRSRHNRRQSRSRDSCRSRGRSCTRYEGRYRERSQSKCRNSSRERSSSRTWNSRERSTYWPSYEASLDAVMKKINKSRSRPVGQ